MLICRCIIYGEGEGSAPIVPNMAKLVWERINFLLKLSSLTCYSQSVWQNAAHLFAQG